MIAIRVFFQQYVLDTNCKHRCEHDIAIMSLHGKHLVFSCRHKISDVGCVSRGKFDTTKEVAQFLFLFSGQVYGRQRWLGTGTVRTKLGPYVQFLQVSSCFCMVLGFPFVIHECPKQTPIDILFHMHEIDAVVDRYVFLVRQFPQD